jgi:16S rRNA (guanine527-N7)-methyltransferase
MERAWERKLRDAAPALSDPAIAAFGKYLELLRLWNRRINLTAIREPHAIIDKHFVDSLAVAAHVSAETRRLVDVGSGAGFPGAVIALARPDLDVTLVESNHKKAAFLQTLRRELPLPRVEVLAVRAETLPDRPGFRPFDVAVSRATWDVPEWIALARHLVVAPGGTILSMEGSERHELPAGARRKTYQVAGAERAVVIVET